MLIDVLSLFPDYFDSPLQSSILGRAVEKGVLKIRQTQLRDFAEGKYQKVDDRPYGGGAGMVLMPKPVSLAIRSVKRQDSHVIYLSPQGKPLTAALCEHLSKMPHLVLVCGHYEGLDERVIEQEVDEEISIGDYVLTNGCLAALVLIDGMARFIPGVLGHEEGAVFDSFQQGKLEGPCYTRPEEFEGMRVPEVLLSGHHEKIAEWKEKQGLEKTRRVRPDLLG